MEEIQKQKVLAAQRGEKFKELKKSPYWNPIVEVFGLLSDQWTFENRNIRSDETIDQIAVGRLKSVYQLKGLESLFRVIEDDIETFKELTKEETNDGRKKRTNR